MTKLAEAVLLGAAILSTTPAVRTTRPFRVVASDQAMSAPSATGEHRYRVVAKIRLILFWAGSDNVGSGRIRWHHDGAIDNIALLVGSDPNRAPRGINAWGYFREQVEGNRATVFGVRTLTDPDSLEQAEARLAEGTGPELFGALCSTVTPSVDRTMTTSVRAGAKVTYRDFSQLLDVLSRSTRWTQRNVARPPDTAPGFLTALHRLLLASVTAPTSAAQGTARSMPYVYKAGVYDLQLQESETIAEFRIGSQSFRDVRQSRFNIRNRTTNADTSFVLTYGTAGPLAAIPIQATYQPHWWLKLELALDEQADAPPDPAADDVRLERIRTMCRAHEQ